MMIMTDIQQWWTQEYEYLLRAGRASKNPMSALFEMYRRYEALTNSERDQINDLLVTWVEDSNDDKRFAAHAIVEEYKIVAAIPAMGRLCERLKRCNVPDNPDGFYERQKVLGKIDVLSSVLSTRVHGSDPQ